MPLLNKEEIERMLAQEGVFCHQCNRYTRKNYCRQCDEFFQEGHNPDCPGRENHDGHRMYDLTKTAQENIDTIPLHPRY